MLLNRGKLLDAMKRCLPGIDQAALLLEGADTFIFKDGKIYTFNDNISVAVSFESPEPLVGAIKAKELYELTSRFTSEEITLVPDDTSWKITAGRATATLALMEAKTIDRIKGILTKDAFEPLPAPFQEAIKTCQFSGNRSSLSGIFVVDNFMMATDEIRVNLFEFSQELKTFWIGDPAAKELSTLPGLKEYSLTPSWVHFKTESGTIFSCKRLIDAKFPYGKLKSIVSQNQKEDGDFFAKLPKGLLDSMARASALAMDMEKLKAVQLYFFDEGVEVYSERATGNYKELIPWDEPLSEKMTPVVIYIDHSMVEYGLKRSTTFYIKEELHSKRIIFQTESSTHIVGTISAPEEDALDQGDE